MKRKFEYLRKTYWGADGIWSDGYFVSPVGVDEKVIQKYIQQQGQEDNLKNRRCLSIKVLCSQFFQTAFSTVSYTIFFTETPGKRLLSEAF